MLNILFPYVMQLHILQLEEYNPIRFLTWVLSNPFKRYYSVKKKLVWTFKAKFILYSALIYVIIFNLVLILLFKCVGIFIGIMLATQAYIFLLAGILTIKPYEILNRTRVKRDIGGKILSLKQKNLKIIGIAGSYGKTSVKEFLYGILKTKYKVLRTPESYNTLFGVAKVIDYELDDYYDFFICEMGAYKIGEIKEICEMVKPDHAILTGINEQHIDRFKKIENTIKAKFEILEYSDDNGFKVLIGTNTYVHNNYLKYADTAVLYGLEQSGFFVKNVESTKTGSKFTMMLNGNQFEATSKLIGNSNIENILAAATMATLLGVEPNLILQAISNLTPVSHRLEIKTWQNGLTVIDDAYSSNVTGFKAALDLLGTFSTLEKVIVTPGIVELGNKTQEIHNELGKLIDLTCDKVLLIGKNERTLAINEGISNKEKVVFINSLEELPKHLTNTNNSIALIENDLPDNY